MGFNSAFKGLRRKECVTCGVRTEAEETVDNRAYSTA